MKTKLLFNCLITGNFMLNTPILNFCSVSTCPRLPHIFAWMEGYICFSFIVIVISLSRIAVTRWRLASSLCLQNRTRFDNHGVMYSRQRCFSSIPKIEIHFIIKKPVLNSSSCRRKTPQTRSRNQVLDNAFKIWILMWSEDEPPCLLSIVLPEWSVYH